MGSVERSKKKVQLWKKAIVHFSLCFVMGFFTGFAPTGKASIFSNKRQIVSASNSSQLNSPQPVEMLHQPQPEAPNDRHNVNRSLIAASPVQGPTRSNKETEPEKSMENDQENEVELIPRRLVIIVTPTSSRDRYQGVFLRRLANTIKLVPPPLLWIVVEGQSDSDEVSQILRKSGIMYRHLVFKENFTDTEAELDHQRNVALRHIEQHRLSGIVHFAGLSNVYDLDFFNELREIEVFGTWPMAILGANRKKVIIEGPVCDSTLVLGWHLKKMNSNETETETDTTKPPPIHISSFGFNSSILWDPERWGRPSSVQDTSQNSIKFVKEVVLEDDTKLKGIPPQDCSKIMLWRLHFPIGTKTAPNNHHLTSASDDTPR